MPKNYLSDTKMPGEVEDGKEDVKGAIAPNSNLTFYLQQSRQV